MIKTQFKKKAQARLVAIWMGVYFIIGVMIMVVIKVKFPEINMGLILGIGYPSLFFIAVIGVKLYKRYYLKQNYETIK
jgi:hypothetical protein